MQPADLTEEQQRSWKLLEALAKREAPVEAIDLQSLTESEVDRLLQEWKQHNQVKTDPVSVHIKEVQRVQDALEPHRFKDYDIDKAPWLVSSRKGEMRVWRKGSRIGIEASINDSKKEYFVKYITVQQAKVYRCTKAHQGESLTEGGVCVGVWNWQAFWDELVRHFGVKWEQSDQNLAQVSL